MVLAVGLIIVGVLVYTGSFLYAVVNIVTRPKNVSGPNSVTDPFTSFGGMFKRQIKAMISMGIGGLLLVGGTIMLVVQTLSKTI